MKFINYFLIVILFSGCFGATPEKTELEGKPIPNYTILLTDSSTNFNTNQIPINKSFVIFYFSPECPYCRSMIDDIISDYDKLKNIEFLLVSNYSLSDIKKFYNNNKLNNYSNFLVGKDINNQIADYYQISSIPYLAIYGKGKRLKKAFIGKIYPNQIKKVAED